MVRIKQSGNTDLFVTVINRRVSVLGFCIFFLSVVSSACCLSGNLTACRYGGSAISPWLDVKVSLDLDKASSGRVECWLEYESDHSGVPTISGQVRSFEFRTEDELWEGSFSGQGQWFWLVGVDSSHDWQVAGRVIIGENTLVLDPVSIDPVKLGEVVTVEVDSNGYLAKSVTPGHLVRYRLVPNGEVQEVAVELGDRKLSSVYLGTGLDEVDVYLDAEKKGSVFKVKGCGDAVVESSIAAEDLVWLKTLEWNFSRSPVATGWEQKKNEKKDSYIIPWYHRDSSILLRDKLDLPGEKPFLPERLHRLAIESKLNGNLVGGWKLENLFRAPKTKEQQRLAGKNHRDQFQTFPNRVLRFEIILSADVPGDQIPVIQFCLTEGDEWFRYTLEELLNEKGLPLEAGEFGHYTFYYTPPHHLTDHDFKAIDFEFVVCGEEGVKNDKSTVFLDNLIVFETVVGDLCGNDQQISEQWPMVSPFFVDDRDAIKSYDFPDTDALFGAHTIRPARASGIEALVSFQSVGGVYPSDQLNEKVYKGPYKNGVLALSDQEGKTKVLPWDPFHGSGVFGLHFDGSTDPVLLYTGRDPLKEGDVRVQVFDGTDDWLDQRIETDHQIVSSEMPLGVMTMTRKGSDGEKRADAVWTANADELTSSGVVVLHQSVEGSVLELGKSDGRVIFQELNSDSGVPELDSQNPTLLYDKGTDLYYLAVVKNCSYYPGHGFLSDYLILDSDLKKILLTDVISGDRSVLKDLSHELYRPVDMIPMGKKPFEPSLHFDRDCWYDYSVLVLDKGNSEQDIPGALVKLDCLTGNLEPFVASSGQVVELNEPREMERVPNLFYGEDRWEGCLIADEEGILLAKRPLDSSGAGSITRVLSVKDAGNLEIHEYGIGCCREFFATKDHPQAFNIAANRYGKPPVDTGGEIYIHLLNPGVNNAPLSIWFHRDVDDVVVCVYLATNERGEAVSTQEEVIDAIEESEKGDLLKVVYDPSVGGEVVLPQSKKLPGGLSGRKLFYTAMGPGSQYPVVWECNITDIDNPGKPVVVGRTGVSWDPVSLLYHRSAVYVLDGESKALYELDLDEGPAFVEPEDAVLSDILSPVAIEKYLGKVYLYLEDEVWTVDMKGFARGKLMINEFGYGERYQSIRAGFPVHWDVEENDGGVKVYWSRQDEKTGFLEPFTHDRYIGWFPYHDAEFFSSEWCGAQENGPWLLSVNNQPFNRKLEIMSIQTSPPSG